MKTKIPKNVKHNIFTILLIVAIFLLAFTTFYSIPSIPQVQAEGGTTAHRGLSWYGLDSDSFDSYFKLNEANYDLMYSRYPNMTVLVLPFSYFSYGYSARLNRLKDFVGWCEDDGLKVIISNYGETYNKATITSYWEDMATLFNGNTTILGFDLVNEPWGMSGSPEILGWTGLVDDYVDMIQAIRAIDPNRKCYVQNYGKNWNGTAWAAFIPAMESALSTAGLSNVDYINHIYSHDWNTGAWRTSSYIYPWIPYYSSGDYATGYSELHDECWDDFAQYINTYNIEFFFTETATKDDANSRRYYTDLIDILEGWGCDWAYHSYYSGEDRPLALTFPNTATERGHADTVRTCMKQQTIFSSFEDGFESGDFDKWNETQTSNGEATITSSIVHGGSYAANFTVTGASNSYARVYYTLEYSQREIYQRTYFRLEDLPDTDGCTLLLFRISDATPNYMAYSGIYRGGGSYYWRLVVDNTTDGILDDYEVDTINVDQWYCYEMYLNATVNGNATVWVDGIQKNSLTGDFSGLNEIARMYLMNYILGTTQSGSKTVYHDTYRVDTERIGAGTPALFKASFYSTSEDGPLQNVEINGTQTDANGYVEFSNLTYNTIYAFLIKKPAGYYAGWILNADGEFSWNGTHFLLYHNVTEEQEDYIQAYFASATGTPYINATDAKLNSASFIGYLFDFTAYKTGGTSTTDIHTSGNGNATYVYNSQSWSYNAGTDIIQVIASHSSSVSLQVSWGFMATYTLENQNTAYETGGVYPYLTSSNGTITALSSTTYQSTFTVQHTTGTSQTNVYTMGLPVKSMTGQSSYNYDRPNNKITVYALHSSSEEIIILWGSEDAASSSSWFPFLDFIWAGDYLGFIQAVYVNAFQSADLFWGILIFLFMTPLYIRTRSLLLMSIIWVLLGSFFLVATPIVSGLAVLLLSLGVAGMFFKLFMKTRT